MTYKDELKSAMDELAIDPAAVFLGYNVKYGSQANGTLANAPARQLIETPVAENLMVGLAIGMSLDGWKPVVYIERFDFILNAIDAIVNHLDKLAFLSAGEFKPKVILRVLVGGKKHPLFTGPTHTQDFSTTLRGLLGFPVIQLLDGHRIKAAYRTAWQADHSTLLVEYRDLYGQQV